MADETEKELEEELSELASRIERLRVLYQQYFMGMEKFPPSIQRDQLEKRIRQSVLMDVRRSSLKFRFMSTIQRLRTYEIYWDRIVRQIEEGTFRRGIFHDGRDVPRDVPPAAPEKPANGKGQKKGRAAGPKARGKGEDLDELYKTYVEARESQDLSVEGITPETFRESLESQRRLKAEVLGVKDVQFSVKVKKGKVILEARRKN